MLEDKIELLNYMWKFFGLLVCIVQYIDQNFQFQMYLKMNSNQGMYKRCFKVCRSIISILLKFYMNLRNFYKYLMRKLINFLILGVYNSCQILIGFLLL